MCASGWPPMRASCRDRLRGARRGGASGPCGRRADAAASKRRRGAPSATLPPPPAPAPEEPSAPVASPAPHASPAVPHTGALPLASPKIPRLRRPSPPGPLRALPSRPPNLLRLTLLSAPVPSFLAVLVPPLWEPDARSTATVAETPRPAGSPPLGRRSRSELFGRITPPPGRVTSRPSESPPARRGAPAQQQRRSRNASPDRWRRGPRPGSFRPRAPATRVPSSQRSSRWPIDS